MPRPPCERWFNTDAVRCSFRANKTLQLRVDALNVLNNETYANPNLNPTSTQFGQITGNNGTYMRFVTFVTKLTF